jgi:dipeptidyl aminopeptidase/acylaminoacyl peptidase
MPTLFNSVLLAGSILVGGAGSLFARDADTAQPIEQLPASAYARAEAVVPQNVRKLIFGMSVHPHWIGKASRFWYEKQTREGRAYLLIDPAAGTTRPLFDHEALIGALAGATGKPIERKNFKLPGLEVDDKTGTLRFAHDGKSWKYDPNTRALMPDTDLEQSEQSPDGAWRAVVREGNLFVVSTKGAGEKQLTTDGTPETPYATPVIDPKIMIAQGTSHPVVQPVLSWSPDSRRIATFRLSLKGARRLALVQSTPPDGAQPRVFDYVYTLPGDTETPLAQGMIFDLETGKRTDMMLPPEPVLYYFGPDFVWSADSKAVFERVAERGYKRLKLYRVDALTGASTLLSEDRSDTYIDTWTQFWSYDDKSDTVYWTADETGFFHIYAIDAHTGARRQLTSGDWVVRGVAGVDATAGKVLIIGTGREAGRNPYVRHLYAVPRKGGAVKQLTPEMLDHDVSVSPDGRYFVDNMSSINQATRSVLRRGSDGRILMELGRADISDYLAAGYRLPEPFEALAADGKTRLYGSIFKPADFNPAKRYPIMEEIYAGPQMIAYSPTSFEVAMTQRFISAHVQIGAIGVLVDGRGTAGRSRAFQQPAYRNLHAVGLDDHIAAIRAAAAKNPWMDISRVGIYGYSAGGYDVVRALEERPDFYQVGLTGCGVQDNRLDKAWWNEEWMGSDPGPFWDANSNIQWASKLTGKLMIVHGELDENVPLSNSLRLVDALMKANKDFELLIIPNANHPVMARPYFYRRSWDFFTRELLGKTPPKDYPMKPYD